MDSFNKEYPGVALAIHFRELEDRLLATLMAHRDQQKAAWDKARRDQHLTRLETEAKCDLYTASSFGIAQLSLPVSAWEARLDLVAIGF